MRLPDLGFSPHHFLGLSIGKTALRGIELNINKEVASFAQVPLAANVLDGGIIKTDLFVAALKAFVLQGHFSSNYVAVTIPESYAYCREHILPNLSDEEITEAVSWQVKDLFPFSADQIYFDWKMLKKEKDAVTILIVAVQKTIIDNMIACLVGAGLKPVSFTPSASILAPLMKLKEDEVALLLEINNRGSMATVVEHTVSFLTTTTAFENPITPQVIQQIALSARSLLTYYQDKKRLPSSTIRIVITGESATADIAVQLGSALSCPTTLLQIPKVPPPYHKAYAGALIQHTRPEDTATINLLPQNVQELYELETLFESLRGKGIVALCILAFSITISVVTFMTVMLQKGSLTTETEALNTQLTTAGFNRSNVALINGQAAQIVSLFPLKKTPQHLFAEVQKLVPVGIDISLWGFDAKEHTLRLEGIASRRENILVFQTALEKVPEIKKVQVPLSSLELPENVHFSIVITVSE